MSGRDFGRGGRGGFGERRGGFGDRDDRRGGFREGGPRPWERRDDDRPPRDSGDRLPDRPARYDERDVRVERYYEEPLSRPRRDEREDRPRFGGDRNGGESGPRQAPPAQRQSSGSREERVTLYFVAPPMGARLWTPHHLTDSWYDEERLRDWSPTDQEVQEMVEDHLAADPMVPRRDRRTITISASGGVVTLSGVVRSRLVRLAAGSDATWTYGVEEVRNELTIKSRAAQSAEAATATATPAPDTSAATDAAAVGEETTEEAPAPPKRATRRRTTTASSDS